MMEKKAGGNEEFNLTEQNIFAQKLKNIFPFIAQ